MSAGLVVPIAAGIDARRELVGGKAHSLARMAALGLPVPPAFVVPTSVCDAFHGGDDGVLAAVFAELPGGIESIEAQLGRRFGAAPRPLLVSVRSGAPVSMPGMMDTILNLGFDDEVEAALAEESGQPAQVRAMRDGLRAALAPLGGDGADPGEQLRLAVRAVLASWHSPRAVAYRAHHGIADSPGTAVTVQAMVFGNADEESGTGVVFTRNPIDGEPGLHGEWLAQAQGEDLVSGAATPAPLAELQARLPGAFAELERAAATLEAELGEMQDIEFTVESGRLFLLQARAGKRSAEAALRIAVDLAEEGLISREEARRRLTPEVTAAVAGRLKAEVTGRVLCSGEAASPGLSRGTVVTDADEAVRLAGAGEEVVLARETTNPADVQGMIAAAAVITEIGGTTSHAALVTRELGKPCVVGCGRGALAPLAGRAVVVDGDRGEVLAGDAEVARSPRPASRAEQRLAAWEEEAGAGPEAGADGLERAYLRFEGHDAELKATVTAWQLRGEVPNDHSDPAYDAAVVARLRALHADFAPALAEIAELAPSLGAYAPRLDAAIAEVEAGDGKYIASPLVDSYHTVWFELHQQLFDLRGVDRSEAERREG